MTNNKKTNEKSSIKNESKTLYIPLYGKAYVSRLGLFLRDDTAEKIWDEEGFSLRGKSKSKWLAYYMGIRAAVFDDFVRRELSVTPDATVIHIGCGMDSRVLRVGGHRGRWYDVDFPEVIAERLRYFSESENYKMISTDVCDLDWLSQICERERAVVVMEGVSMYLETEKLRGLLSALTAHFSEMRVLFDAYSTFAAKMSKYKNPVGEVGVKVVYGLDDPALVLPDGLNFVAERNMTPDSYIAELRGVEKWVFGHLYAGKFARGLYKLYEYEKSEKN